MMFNHKFNHFRQWGLTFLGAIAPLTLTLFTIVDLASVFPSQSIQAEQASLIDLNQKQTQPKVVKIAGTYKIFIDPKVLEEAKKEGIKAVSGTWTIKPNGFFEASLEVVSVQDELQTIQTTGIVSIINGKVVSQVKTVNGTKPETTPPQHSYTLQSDGKTLQSDTEPVQLIRQ